MRRNMARTGEGKMIEQHASPRAADR